MSYTKQTWIDNTTPLSAARMNYMEAGIEAVTKPAFGLLSGAGMAVQAVGTAVWSQITLGAGAGSKASNGVTVDVGNSRLVVQTAGTYLVTGTVAYSANQTGRRVAEVFKNGAEVIPTQQGMLAIANTHVIGTSTAFLDLVAGDFIDLRGYQDSGATLNFVRDYCQLSMLLVFSP